MSRVRPDYDIVILGGGSAGIVAGVMAGALKMRVLLIESKRMGGECLNTGCVPSKALLHAARVAKMMRTASSVGLRDSEVTRDDAASVLTHVRETIGTVREADATEDLLRQYGVEIRIGSPRFLDPHTLEINEATVRADHFIIATGSSPARLSIPGLDEAGYRTNQTLFDLDAIPEALLVVGGGPNGVEMAQAFARLGSQVTLLQKGDRILPRDDRELTSLLADCLRADGVNIRLNAELQSVRLENRRKVATFALNGETKETACEEIFVAIGRVPNTTGLNLEAAGVRYDAKKVETDANLRTTTPHIYACGDLVGSALFSHIAEYEAKTVVRNIVFPGESKASFRLAPWTTFTDPELSHLGLTEDEAKALDIRYDVLRQPFAQNDRALTDASVQGLVKVLTHGIGGKILGVSILGPHSGELLQEWTLAMQHGLSIRAVADLVHVYPTLSMANQHAAQRWYEQKAAEPLADRLLTAYAQTVRPRQKMIATGLVGTILFGMSAALYRLQNSPQRRKRG